MKEVNDQPKQAVALRYRPDRDDAPYVSAKGVRETARKMIETAKLYGIPIQEDETLASLLMTLDIGEAIPPELYEVVAEVFRFIYSLDQSLPSAHPANDGRKMAHQ
jgi:flagellar biosynthesis protein